MERPSPLLSVDGTPAIWLGANFWSRSGGPLMWTTYDPAVVREELRVLADHGLNLTRSFFYWPDFHPEPDLLDEQCIANFQDFLDAHLEFGLTTVPTFLVGHMSGENWDPAWRGGRDLYSDIWFVGRQSWYVRELTARFAEHPAIAGWLITNEMPIYGGEAPRPVVAAWAEILVNAVRAGGGTQPVSIGDGAWGIETTGHDNGFSAVDLAGVTDFIGPHVYRMETDQIRQHLKAAFIAELCAISEQPIIMEEFGLTSDFVSPAGAASYYRQLLHNTLLAGATGWIAWNNTDYDTIIGQRPYSHHPFELHFGITDSTGRAQAPAARAGRVRRHPRIGRPAERPARPRRRRHRHRLLPRRRLPLHQRVRTPAHRRRRGTGICRSARSAHPRRRRARGRGRRHPIRVRPLSPALDQATDRPLLGAAG